jgi:hypothetical protein
MTVDIKISQLSNVASSELTDLFEISRLVSGTDYDSFSINYYDLLHSIVGQRTVTVDESGSMASTITEGISLATALSPSVSAPVVVIVYPGVYTEDSIVIPPYVSVMGMGGSKGVIVNASDTDNIMFTMSLNTALVGFRLQGATGANGVAVKSTSTTMDCIIDDVIVRNCTIGFYATGVGSSFRASNIALLSISSTTDYGVLVEDGAVVNISNLVVRTAGSGVLTTGICVTGSSSVANITGFNVDDCVNGIYANDGGFANTDTAFIDSATNGFRVGSTGSDSHISSFASSLTNISTYSVFIESASGHVDFSGLMDYDKRSIVDGGELHSYGINSATDKLKLTGETNIEQKTDIGYPGVPADDTGLDVGEGGSYSIDEQGNEIVEYWQYDNSAASGSRFTRYANNAGTQLTDVSDAIIVGSKFPFAAARLDITTAANLGSNSIVTEHWDGSTWVSDQICGYAKSTMTHRGDTIFQNVETQYVEVGLGITDDWISDQNVLDEVPDWDAGYNMYPLRFRNNGGSLTTAMEFEDGRVRGDDFDITEAKEVVNWGRFRQTNVEVKAISEMQPSSVNPPQSVTVDISPNITNNLTALYTDGNVSSSTFHQIIPTWADTSSGITLSVAMYGTNTNIGNINIVVRYLPIAAGFIFDGTATEYSASLIAVTLGTANLLIGVNNTFDISSFSPGDSFTVSIERDATAGNPLDTYVGDVVITGVQMTWTRKIVG